MALTLNSYADVQKHLNDILTANGQVNDTKHAPHKDWWNSVTYEQFVSGNVPGVSDPNTGQPMPILVKGDAAQSNIILALQGTPGTVFDNNSGAIGQMPADGPPFFTQEQIQPLIDWINAGCPNGELPPERGEVY
ncbi:MAG: hypothetical protein ACJ754_06305 [Pyrinomonadaceae bacterium]